MAQPRASKAGFEQRDKAAKLASLAWLSAPRGLASACACSHESKAAQRHCQQQEQQQRSCRSAAPSASLSCICAAKASAPAIAAAAWPPSLKPATHTVLTSTVAQLGCSWITACTHFQSRVTGVRCTASTPSAPFIMTGCSATSAVSKEELVASSKVKQQPSSDGCHHGKQKLFFCYGRSRAAFIIVSYL